MPKPTSFLPEELPEATPAPVGVAGMRLFGEVVQQVKPNVLPKSASIAGFAISVLFFLSIIFGFPPIRKHVPTFLGPVFQFTSLMLLVAVSGTAFRRGATELRLTSSGTNGETDVAKLDMDALAKLKSLGPVDWTMKDSVGGWLIRWGGQDVLLWKRNWKEGTRKNPSGDGDEVCRWSVWVKDGVSEEVALDLIRKTWFKISIL